MIRDSFKRSALAVLGAGLLVFQLVHSPLATSLALLVFAVVWWLRRERRGRIARFHRRKLRREIISSGLVVAAIWVAVALFRTAVDMGRQPVDEEQLIERPADTGPWPGQFLVDGLLGTVAATYLLLSLDQSGRKRRRRRRSAGGGRELVPVKVESDPRG